IHISSRIDQVLATKLLHLTPHFCGELFLVVLKAEGDLHQDDQVVDESAPLFHRKLAHVRWLRTGGILKPHIPHFCPGPVDRSKSGKSRWNVDRSVRLQGDLSEREIDECTGSAIVGIHAIVRSQDDVLSVGVSSEEHTALPLLKGGYLSKSILSGEQ